MPDTEEKSLHSSDAEAYFNGEWLHEATIPEVIMETGHKHGSFLIWCQLDLKSALPLQEEHVRKAVAHLYRKVPSLAVCYGNRDGTMWMRKASNPNIDFKVLRGLHVEEARENLRNHRYNSDTGPLFCVRMLKDSPDSIDDTDGLEPQMHHDSYIFFGFHHGITDGTSDYLILGFFISLLNDVISNKPIDECEELGTFVSPHKYVGYVQEKAAAILADATLRARLESENEQNSKVKPQLIYNFLKNPGEAEKTSTIDAILDLGTTAKFIKHCKMEKVTVHSALVAVTNRAIVDLLVEDGVIQDSYVILSTHTINTRRYSKEKIPKVLGFHVGYPMMAPIRTPKDLDGNFWDYTRSVHQILKRGIETEKTATDFALKILSSPPNEDIFSEETMLSEKEYICDYETANLGDVTPSVTEGGKHVRILHIIQSTTMQHTDYPILLGCNTYRGKLTLIIDYNTAVVKADIAERFLAQIIARLKDSFS